MCDVVSKVLFDFFQLHATLYEEKETKLPSTKEAKKVVTASSKRPAKRLQWSRAQMDAAIESEKMRSSWLFMVVQFFGASEDTLASSLPCISSIVSRQGCH